jgi:hypothetical protein
VQLRVRRTAFFNMGKPSADLSGITSAGKIGFGLAVEFRIAPDPRQALSTLPLIQLTPLGDSMTAPVKSECRPCSVFLLTNVDFTLPALLLLARISWFFREPAWPSFLFTAVVDALCLALMALVHAHRFDVPESDPETIVRVVTTSVVMLVVGAIFLAVGFAEVKLVKASRKKKKSRAIRTPAGPPML